MSALVGGGRLMRVYTRALVGRGHGESILALRTVASGATIPGLQQ